MRPDISHFEPSRSRSRQRRNTTNTLAETSGVHPPHDDFSPCPVQVACVAPHAAPGSHSQNKASRHGASASWHNASHNFVSSLYQHFALNQTSEYVIRCLRYLKTLLKNCLLGCSIECSNSTRSCGPNPRL